MDSTRYKIIMVDDNMAYLTQGKSILKAFYEVFPAPSAAKLFEILDNVLPDLILLDIEMPEMNGYEVIKKLKENKSFADIPVIFLTSKSDETSEIMGFNLGATDYVSKPFSAPRLLKRIENQILIAKQKKDLQDYANNLSEMVQVKVAEVVHLQNSILTTVADLVEFRDKVTGGHITRTMLYLKTLLDAMIRDGIYKEEVSQWDMSFILPSSQLHDVGKIAITDLILNKPSKLTPEEFEIMKTHVVVGADVIKKIIFNTKENDFLKYTLALTETHHEKWDGSGYPAGLKGKDIPLEGRLMAIVDVYDALISNRPYKKPLSHEEASKIIENGAGTDFDPVLVDVFRSVKDEFAVVAKEIGT